MPVPKKILSSNFFHAASNHSGYIEALNQFLPEHGAYIHYLDPNNTDNNIIAITYKIKGETHLEEINTRILANDNLEVWMGNSNRYESLKKILEAIRSYWQNEYKAKLNFIFDYATLSDESIQEAFGEHKIDIAIKNINQFLTLDIKKITEIIGVKLPSNKNGYTLVKLCSGFYLVAPTLFFSTKNADDALVISSTQVKQLIELTHKKVTGVHFYPTPNSQKTPDTFYKKSFFQESTTTSPNPITQAPDLQLSNKTFFDNSGNINDNSKQEPTRFELRYSCSL